jgi:hypothetical protein
MAYIGERRVMLGAVWTATGIAMKPCKTLSSPKKYITVMKGRVPLATENSK